MNENYFLTRKSCRNFRPDPIEDKLLQDIVMKAAKAPTCGNMQLYTIIVTKDAGQKNLLASCHYNQPAAVTSPVILTICADFNRFTKWCEINDADAGYNNFHSFIMAMTDSIILAQQITTIAENEGLGTCYLGTVTYNADKISELLKLPDLVIPVASLAIGFPQEEGEDTLRLSTEAILHNETYKNFSEEEIEGLYKVHDLNPENQPFIRENGKDNLAQVFAEIRYPRDLNEKISSSFLDLLKKKDFLS